MAISLSYLLDGTQVTATSVTAQLTNGILSIGSNAAGSTILGFAFTPTGGGTGTYTLGFLSSANAQLQVGNPAQGWQAAVGLGSGSITLTSLTSTSVSGTFQFTMVPSTGAGTRNITQGQFNVTLTTAPAPSPTPSTNTFSATISGTPWTASLSRSARITAGLLTITGQDTSGRVVTMVLVGVSQLSLKPGDQPAHVNLGTGGPSTMLMTLGATSWSNGFAGATGEALISAISSAHVTGTFTVTLIGPTGTPNAVFTNGQFDLDITP